MNTHVEGLVQRGVKGRCFHVYNITLGQQWIVFEMDALYLED